MSTSPYASRSPRATVTAAYCLAAFWAVALASDEPAPTGPGPVGNELRQWLLRAAGSDAGSGPEDLEQRAARRARQNALLAELAEAEEHRGPTAAREPVHALLWDRAWVLLSPGARRQRLAGLLSATDRLQAGGSEAIVGVCRRGGATEAVAARLLERWERPVVVRALYVGAAASAARPAALYVPRLSMLLLDFNWAAEEPDRFLDSVEHELWHHLLPAVTAPGVARNLWWEGFTEVLAETWSAELSATGSPGCAEAADGAVAYPLVTACASLVWALDPAGVLDWLTDPAGGAPPLPHWRAAAHQQLGAAGAALLGPLGLMEPIPTPLQRRLEACLADWGWHEDDGTPARLDGLLSAGCLDATRIAAAFADNRSYLMAAVDAWAVCLLQDLRGNGSGQRLRALAEARLSPALQANLRRALNYVADPAQPLR